MDVERASETIAPPRRLRLDELLRELGAHAGDEPPPLRRATITQASEYDLVGEVADDGVALESARPPAPPSLVHKSSDGRRVLRTL